MLFLNDDIEIVDPGWLTELVGQALRDFVGAVGCLLLYPDRKSSTPVCFSFDYGGGAVHLFRGLFAEGEVYLDLHRVQREVAAVTGACLMVRRSLFERSVASTSASRLLGTISTCACACCAPASAIWTPRPWSTMSVSRRDTSISDDEARIWQLWGDQLRTGDPYHQPAFREGSRRLRHRLS